MRDPQLPAVVVGAASCGLGLVRSLARSKVPVIVVDKNPIEPGMHSRFARGFVVSALSGRSLVDDLLALSKSLDRPAVLFVTADEMVFTISEFRKTLEEAYCFSLPSHQQLAHANIEDRLSKIRRIEWISRSRFCNDRPGNA